MRKQAFTLAEILISMLILGIIVASTVPVILHMSPNKNAIMMKKAYYTTESVVHSLINDQNYYPEKINDDGTTTVGFDNTDPVTVNGTNITAKNDNKLPCLFASKLNIREDLAKICDGTKSEINTMDGITWNLATIKNYAGAGLIEIDVDGKENGVHSYYNVNKTNSSTLTGLCANTNTWGASSCTTTLTNLAKRKFDRMTIEVKADGQLLIPETTTTIQEEVLKILNGTKKLLGGDED